MSENGEHIHPFLYAFDDEPAYRNKLESLILRDMKLELFARQAEILLSTIAYCDKNVEPEADLTMQTMSFASKSSSIQISR